VAAVTDVRFYWETVKKIADGHPEVYIELPSIMSAAIHTLTSPAMVIKSHSNTYVFLDDKTTNASGDPLQVVVRLVAGASGRVTSVYFAKPSSSSEVVWRKS
jgi:hypothetical protein